MRKHVGCMALMVLVTLGSGAACARSGQEVMVGAPPVGAAAPGSTAAPVVAPTTTGVTVTAGTQPAPVAAVARPSDPPEVAAARPSIGVALKRHGRSDAFAVCVVDRLTSALSGKELGFALRVLSLADPTEAQVRAAVDQSGIDRSASADLPQRIFGIEDSCREVDREAPGSAPPGSTVAPPVGPSFSL